MICSEGQNGEFGLDLRLLVKTMRIGDLQIENKTESNMKKNSLKHWASKFEILR